MLEEAVKGLTGYDDCQAQLEVLDKSVMSLRPVHSLLAEEWFLPMSARDLMSGSLAIVDMLDMLLLFVSFLLLLSYWEEKNRRIRTRAFKRINTASPIVPPG